MSAEPFVQRVLSHLPAGTPSRYDFQSWNHGGRPTSEGFGLLPVSGHSVDAFAAAVMDVAHYTGNVEYVEESRAIADPRFQPPGAVRFYQRVKVPVLATLHHELVLTDMGDKNGYRVLAWHLLEAESAHLDPKLGARSDYNLGAWLVSPNAVGYALSSCPKKDDVGRLKFAALTKGADAAAAKVVKGTIEGMVAWSKRR